MTKRRAIQITGYWIDSDWGFSFMLRDAGIKAPRYIDPELFGALVYLIAKSK